MDLNKPTDELDELLTNLKPNEVAEFLEKNKEYMAGNDEKKRFYFYFTETLRQKRIKLKDVYSFAGETESYGSKVVSGEKHTTDRDCILRLCLAGHFNLDQINRALKLYGMTELYARDPRDACIIVAVNQRRYRLDELDDLLTKQGFRKITKDKKMIT